MTNDRDSELTPEEVEGTGAEPLPDRGPMSLIVPEPGVILPDTIETLPIEPRD